MNIKSCDELAGHLRAICEGTHVKANGECMSLSDCNTFRAIWGLPPLPNTEAHPPIPQPPSIWIRGWNFAWAMTRWAAAGLPRRSQAEIDARLAICQSCEFLNHQHCTKCGCGCEEKNRLMNKLALSTERCPIGKWPAEDLVPVADSAP